MHINNSMLLYLWRNTFDMKKIKTKKLLYKVHILECLSQNIDDKIDNPPMSYNQFSKRLNNVEKCGIINKKH